MTSRTPPPSPPPQGGGERRRAMTGFPDKAVIAELTAKMLLEVDAVRFMTDKPFIYTSGWASPVYTDCRRLISFPRVRSTLIDFGVATVLRDAGFGQFFAGGGGGGATPVWSNSVGGPAGRLRAFRSPPGWRTA